MSWVMVASMGAGLATGAMRTKQQQKQAEADRKLRAEEIRYSPWSGIKSFTDVKNPDGMGNLMQGGLAGASMGQGMAGAPGASAAAPVAAPHAAMAPQMAAKPQAEMKPFSQPVDDPSNPMSENYKAFSLYKRNQSPWSF